MTQPATYREKDLPPRPKSPLSFPLGSVVRATSPRNLSSASISEPVDNRGQPLTRTTSLPIDGQTTKVRDSDPLKAAPSNPASPARRRNSISSSSKLNSNLGSRLVRGLRSSSSASLNRKFNQDELLQAGSAEGQRVYGAADVERYLQTGHTQAEKTPYPTTEAATEAVLGKKEPEDVARAGPATLLSSRLGLRRKTSASSTMMLSKSEPDSSTEPNSSPTPFLPSEDRRSLFDFPLGFSRKKNASTHTLILSPTSPQEADDPEHPPRSGSRLSVRPPSQGLTAFLGRSKTDLTELKPSPAPYGPSLSPTSSKLPDRPQTSRRPSLFDSWTRGTRPGLGEKEPSYHRPPHSGVNANAEPTKSIFPRRFRAFSNSASFLSSPISAERDSQTLDSPAVATSTRSTSQNHARRSSNASSLSSWIKANGREDSDPSTPRSKAESFRRRAASRLSKLYDNGSDAKPENREIARPGTSQGSYAVDEGTFDATSETDGHLRQPRSQTTHLSPSAFTRTVDSGLLTRSQDRSSRNWPRIRPPSTFFLPKSSASHWSEVGGHGKAPIVASALAQGSLDEHVSSIPANASTAKWLRVLQRFGVADYARNIGASLIFGVPIREAVLRTRLISPDVDRWLRSVEQSSHGLSNPELATTQRPRRQLSRVGILDLGLDFSIAALDTSDAAPRIPASRQTARQQYLPRFVTRCLESIEVQALEEEGLYRLSGRSSHTNPLKLLFDGQIDGVDPSEGASNAGWDLKLKEISPADLDINSVTSVFKSFLRDLPEPLLSSDQIRRIEGSLDSRSDELGVLEGTFNNLLSGMEAAKWYLLRELILHLADLTHPSIVSKTKMTLKNLALVFAPTLHIPVNLLMAIVEHRGPLFKAAPAAEAILDNVRIGDIIGGHDTTRVASHEDLGDHRASTASVMTLMPSKYDGGPSATSQELLHSDSASTNVTSASLFAATARSRQSSVSTSPSSDSAPEVMTASCSFASLDQTLQEPSIASDPTFEHVNDGKGTDSEPRSIPQCSDRSPQPRRGTNNDKERATTPVANATKDNLSHSGSMTSLTTTDSRSSVLNRPRPKTRANGSSYFHSSNSESYTLPKSRVGQRQVNSSLSSP